jgi:predicted unusual protein kinase regulating ubiquinone biosynthesis (AarF/ABC1/UbiB family)
VSNPLGGRLGRGSRLARTGARSLATLASAKAREAATGEVSLDSHTEIATRLAEVLGEMKGAAMKLGQLLSFVDFDLPPEVQSAYHDVLATLRDSAPPFDPDAIRRTVTDAYGRPPEAVFAEWSDTPLAAASIGQVHPATLRDGTEVAVKVQYPGVADAVRADLSNAEAFAPLARLISPNLEISALMDELRDRVEDELDYVREASYQHAFATRWQGHPDVRVPAVLKDLCREHVLVTERVHGRSFDEVVASGTEAERQHLGEAIHRFSFGSLARFRLFNADPHPGNYLVTDDGRVAFLDFGAVKMYTKAQWGQIERIDRAAMAGDQDRWEAGLRESRILPQGVDVDLDVVWEWFRLNMRPLLADQPFTYDRDFAAEIIGHASDLRSPYWHVLRKLNLPPEFLVLNRIQVGINSVLGRLRATQDWRAIRAELLDDAEPATAMGGRDAAWWVEAQSRAAR